MRKRMLLVATAITALTAGSGLVFAQSPGAAGGQHNKGAATTGSATAGSKGAATTGSASQQKGSNARGSQGQLRSNEQSGMKGSNARGAQGEKRSTTGQAPNEHNRMGAQKRTNEHRSTTGQAPNQRNNRMGEQNRTNERNRTTTGQAPNQRNNRMGEQNRTNERNRTTTGQGTMENRGGTTRGGSVNLSSDQRTRIHTIISGEHSAPRVGHVDFDVRQGTRIPRERMSSLHLARLPSSIIQIEPSWRGYEYFLVGDQIVVVNPSTLEIVAVLPA